MCSVIFVVWAWTKQKSQIKQNDDHGNHDINDVDDDDDNDNDRFYLQIQESHRFCWQ